MSSPVVYWIGRRESSFARALEEQLRARSVALEKLDLEAPSITLEPRSVSWQGHDLLEASAIVLEQPVVAWPQPRPVGDPGRSFEEVRADSIRDRETRSLLVSALCAASDVVPVLNPLEAMSLVGAPMTALDRLVAEGVAVHPWRLEAVSEAKGLWRDVVASHLWHSADTPRLGEPARRLEHFDEGVLSVLVLGRQLAGAVRYPGSAAWMASESDAVLTAASASESTAARHAEKAAWALPLPIVEVAVIDRADSAVLEVRPAPDLCFWEERLPGGPSSQLARHLEEVIEERPLVRF